MLYYDVPVDKQFDRDDSIPKQKEAGLWHNINEAQLRGNWSYFGPEFVEVLSGGQSLVCFVYPTPLKGKHLFKKPNADPHTSYGFIQ